MHRNLLDILKYAKFNVVNEYDRVYTLFFEDRQVGDFRHPDTLVDVVNEAYRTLTPKLINRTLSLLDFMKTYGLRFSEASLWVINVKDEEQRLEQLVSLCEFVYNFTKAVECYVVSNSKKNTLYKGTDHIRLIIRNIESCMDEIGFRIISKEGLYIIVNTTPEVLAVSEIVKPEIAVNVFEYNHFRMRGQLAEKLSILKLLADDLEPHRKELDEISKNLSSNLFRLLQFFVRHNHTEDDKYKALTKNEIEAWYDDIYQMYLLAKLELDNRDRMKRAKEFWME